MAEAKVEEKISIGSKTAAAMPCSRCGKEIPAGQFFTFKDQKNSDIYVCADCKLVLEEELKKQTQDINYFLALLAGIIGGAAGGAVWYGVAVLTRYEIGYLAIGVGFLVGAAMHFGSGKKRGTGLSVLSALLTLLTIVVAKYFVFMHFINVELAKRVEPLYLSPYNFKTATLIFGEYIGDLFSPIGLVIIAIGIYFAFMFNRPTKI